LVDEARLGSAGALGGAHQLRVVAKNTQIDHAPTLLARGVQPARRVAVAGLLLHGLDG
jgi:hypothetical protein